MPEIDTTVVPVKRGDKLGVVLSLGLGVGEVVKRIERETDTEAVTDTLGFLEGDTDGLGELLREDSMVTEGDMEGVPERHCVVVREGGLLDIDGEPEEEWQGVEDLLVFTEGVPEGETLTEREALKQAVGEIEGE